MVKKCLCCQSIVEELIDRKCKYCLNSFICQSCGKLTLNTEESKHPLNCNSCSSKIDFNNRLGKECLFNRYLYSGGKEIIERDTNRLVQVIKKGNREEITTFK